MDSLADRIGEQFTFASKVLDEERPYWVHLPASYNDASTQQRYPVLYLLDGGGLFHATTSGAVPFMSHSNQIPELIIVAIATTNGIRDLTPTHSQVGADGRDRPAWTDSGGGGTFLQFLGDELLPEIESSYRTLPYRILVGSSIGGLFTLQALLDAPDIFQSHIAIDPSLWWDDQVLVHRAAREFAGAQERRGAVYISLANNQQQVFGPVMMQAGLAFAQSLAAANSGRFRSRHEYFEKEDHGSVFLQSLYHGLQYVFDEYKPSLAIDPSALVQHFERISARLGVKLLPPEKLVHQMGFRIVDQVVNRNRPEGHWDIETAIEFLKLNVALYPNSSAACDGLALAYSCKKDRPAAIKYYEKAVALDPANQEANEQLQKLRAKTG
ncbi:MAG: hypothetical protein GKR89_06915 [Candidatus Latescibacteria bacterium]|nr:hypothetical protein [Candidatus Latescibacterota bacterium]